MILFPLKKNLYCLNFCLPPKKGRKKTIIKTRNMYRKNVCIHHIIYPNGKLTFFPLYLYIYITSKCEIVCIAKLSFCLESMNTEVFPIFLLFFLPPSHSLILSLHFHFVFMIVLFWQLLCGVLCLKDCKCESSSFFFNDLLLFVEIAIWKLFFGRTLRVWKLRFFREFFWRFF